MKKFYSLVMALVMTFGLSACGSSGSTGASPAAQTSSGTPESAAENVSSQAASSAEKMELVVFGAASMTETLTKIGELYQEVAPNVKLTFNFDSSGTLKTQIQEGANCDVFVSAGQKQMNQLDITADKKINTEGLDFVLQGSRKNLLENKVTLCVPKGNPKNIKSFDGLAKRLSAGGILMAMGNSDVPVGQYTEKILTYYKLDEKMLAQAGSITYCSNVKEVTTQITEGSVDCGAVYCTDAFSAGLTPVDYATPKMCGQIIYPAAVMKNSKHPKEAQAFLDYLSTDEAMAVFKAVGFSAV